MSENKKGTGSGLVAERKNDRQRSPKAKILYYTDRFQTRRKEHSNHVSSCSDSGCDHHQGHNARPLENTIANFYPNLVAE